VSRLPQRWKEAFELGDFFAIEATPRQHGLNL
jgi:hypothetical protein